METLTVKTIVNFKEIKDGTVMPFGTNLSEVVAPADKVKEYFEALRNIEAAADMPIEWNQTFETVCQNRVFFTIVPVVEENEDGDDVLTGYEATKIVLLDDFEQVILKEDNICVLVKAENDDHIFETEELAKKAAYVQTYNLRVSQMQKLKDELARLVSQQADIESKLDELQVDVADLADKLPELHAIVYPADAPTAQTFAPDDPDDYDDSL